MKTSRFRPDFDHTATGYVFLDKLTLPYWRWRSRREFRRFMTSLETRDGVIPRKEAG